MITYTKGIVEKTVPEKGFGFIKSEDGARVFFHVSDGGAVAVETDGNNHAVYPRKIADVQLPKVGDELAFILCERKRGLRADPWAPATALVDAIAAIVAMPRYRVVMTKTFVGGKVVGPKTISTEVAWEGTNVEDLSRRFPNLKTARRKNVQISFHYEKCGYEGWTECEDPRRAHEEQAA